MYEENSSKNSLRLNISLAIMKIAPNVTKEEDFKIRHLAPN